MPGPFRLRPPRDEMQPLGIVRQIDCDRELDKLRLQQPRTDTVRRAWDYWLDERIRIRAGGEMAAAPYSPEVRRG